MSPRRFNAPDPGFSTFDRGMAAAAIRGEAREAYAQEQVRRTEFEGQDAGVPGMGERPALWHEPAGSVFSEFLHSAFTPVEWSRRILPTEGWFAPTLTPRTPFQSQLGAYKVPSGLSLWLFDYEFTVYRPSGVDPGDFVQAEEGRYSNQIGGLLQINGVIPGSLDIQLNPGPAPVAREAFSPAIPRGGAPTNAFNYAASTFYGQTTGAGTSLLPIGQRRLGARQTPLTFVVDEGGTVAMTAVVFNRVRSPISAIQARLGGLLIHTQTSKALIERVRPR